MELDQDGMTSIALLLNIVITVFSQLQCVWQNWVDVNRDQMPWIPQEEYVEGQTIIGKSYLALITMGIWKSGPVTKVLPTHLQILKTMSWSLLKI